MSTAKGKGGPKAPRDISDLIAAPAPAPATPAAPSRVLGAAKPAASKPVLQKFSNYITAEDAVKFERLHYWTPGKAGQKVNLFARALELLFASDPNSEKPTPDEA